jgi:hypothetical protein
MIFIAHCCIENALLLHFLHRWLAQVKVNYVFTLGLSKKLNYIEKHNTPTLATLKLKLVKKNLTIMWIFLLRINLRLQFDLIYESC